jgi:hypothetical protein
MVAQTYFLHFPITKRVLNEEAVVEELLDNGTRGWNTTLIKEVFGEVDVAVIRQIPISSYNSSDWQIQKCTTNKEFTMRSAYHVQKEVILSSKMECFFRGCQCDV